MASSSRSAKEQPPVPAGFYPAVFEGASEVDHEELGATTVFSWRIANGEHEGKVVAAIASPMPPACE